MVEVCCQMAKKSTDKSPESSSSRTARRRRIEIRRFKFPAGGVGAFSVEDNRDGQKRKRLKVHAAIFSREFTCNVENCGREPSDGESSVDIASGSWKLSTSRSETVADVPKYGVTSFLGRRKDMEDAVAVHPSFHGEGGSSWHFFGLYDGHGCSHVSARCKERMHEVVKEEIDMVKSSSALDWKDVMEKSFRKMDAEVIAWNEIGKLGANCRCELQPPKCHAVGSTAVVTIVTPDKVIVANCGDSRAVLCRNEKPVPLSVDHKPDRPDELSRIQDAGGRVIYWDGPRVLGVLAMSRALGDNYLKPYVSCVPEVTVTERDAGDECLILASDGLWDVVSNEVACEVAGMCLRGKAGEGAEDVCAVASVLLTKLAIARQSADNISVVVVDLRRDT